ncbi:MAG TPA: hypothetical protein EYG39_08630, partial [Rhodothermales bacterium]|nr:hypothetical protein [Rhodothermales bacterium]
MYANATAVYRLGDYVYWSRTYSWGAIHKAVELRREGVPGEEVAEATGIPRSVVWTIWRRLGLSGTAGRGRRARERETGRDHGALAAEAVRL